jgi:hypothetical protein
MAETSSEEDGESHVILFEILGAKDSSFPIAVFWDLGDDMLSGLKAQKEDILHQQRDVGKLAFDS